MLSDQLARLPARTLAIVFGNHGFKLDAMESRTTSGESGGTSPEEVLVPAFAWLLGGVHEPRCGLTKRPPPSARALMDAPTYRQKR